MNNKDLCLPVLETGKSKIKVLADSVSWFTSGAFLLHAHRAEGALDVFDSHTYPSSMALHS
jgi:hypothetical protein